jgi:hypothetical protein
VNHAIKHKLRPGSNAEVWITPNDHGLMVARRGGQGKTLLARSRESIRSNNIRVMFLTAATTSCRTDEQHQSGPAAVSHPSAFLLPYVTTAANDTRDARNEIIETLESYGTRTRSEMLQAGQIIALGMTTLDVLAEAKTAEMSQSMRLRYRGCANGLNRSTLRTEKAHDERLAYDLPAAPETTPEPVNDVPDADLEIAMAHARTAIEAHRSNRVSANRSEPKNDQRWAGAMIDTLKQMGMPVGPTPGG